MKLPTVMAYPVEGRLILQPDMNYLPFPEEGRLVYRDMFYQRAIMQGDLTTTAPSQPVVPRPRAANAVPASPVATIAAAPIN